MRKLIVQQDDEQPVLEAGQIEEKAAEQRRDEGSFALLDVSPPIGEWLG